MDLPGGTITIYDPKGARTQPRVHMLPLTESTSEIVKRRLDAMQLAKEEPRCKGQADNLLLPGSMWLFSTDGRMGMREETISELVKILSEEMVKAGEAREPFQLRDLRRTAETMLAKLGTGPNIRGEVQSHGLGGVQKRHYDQHDYLEEKRAALQLWASHLAALKADRAVGASAGAENNITGAASTVGSQGVISQPNVGAAVVAHSAYRIRRVNAAASSGFEGQVVFGRAFDNCLSPPTFRVVTGFCGAGSRSVVLHCARESSFNGHHAS